MRTTHVTPLEPEPPLPHEEILETTLGKLAVVREEEAVQHIQLLDNAKNQLDAITEVEKRKVPPRQKPVVDFIGRMAGKTMTRLEAVRASPERKHELLATTEHASRQIQEAETARDGFIMHTRARLVGLNKRQKAMVDSYLNTNVSDEIFASYDEYLSAAERMPKQGAEKRLRWADWLGQKATDKQLFGFLDWHVDALAKQQKSEVVQDKIQQERTDYKRAIQTGIAKGLLHPNVQAAEKVDGIDVYVGDAFDTIIDDIGGYHMRGSTAIIIAQGSGESAEAREEQLLHNINRAIKHEWNHAVLGSMPDRWINEALTENLAQIFNTGQIKPNGGNYIQERTLLANLAVKGPFGFVSGKLATQAYSDPEGQNGQSYCTFTATLDKAWGTRDVLGQLRQRIRANEHAVYEADPTLSLIIVNKKAIELVRKELEKDLQQFFATTAT